MTMTYSVLLLLELFNDSEVEYDRILAETTILVSSLFARPCQQEEHHLATDLGELRSHKRQNKS